MHQFLNVKESSKSEHPVKRYVIRIPTIHKNNRIDNLHLLKLVKNDNILCVIYRTHYFVSMQLHLPFKIQIKSCIRVRYYQGD